MKNGVLYFWKEKKTDTWLFKIIGKAIAFITKGNYTHVAVILNNTVYESTIRKINGKVHNGVQKSSVGFDVPDETWEPIRDLTDTEVLQMVTYAETCISLHIPYSIMKLVILFLVYPTRGFWKKINWFPFKSELLGEICSEFVTQDFKAGQIDLTPKEEAEDDAPVDIVKSGFFKKVG